MNELKSNLKDRLNSDVDKNIARTIVLHRAMVKSLVLSLSFEKKVSSAALL